ncbi:MAG: hypothetical protein KHZ90_08380 [Veillonella parvula]|uniref:Uncharacterized protein n=1 Tax=Veillonella parvula TaxID=29466 RepID=A0A942WP72_VEIPA|nr:hypothetical protein [Veillonella parvula]MBS4893777.1 hypothetical protein [Veillonella parvula]
MKFRKCGIHTRLQFLIDKSGGYDVFAATEKLMEDYNIRNRDIAYEMAKNENIRGEIEAVGLENIIKLTKRSMKLQDMQFASLMGIF